MVSISRRFLVSALAAFAITALAPASASAADSEPLRVVATTGMIADAARRIGGEQVEVRGLMGPGVDPHAFRQTRSDIAAMATAELVLWHGLYLEAQMEDFLLELGERQRVVAVGESVPEEQRLGHDDYSEKYDPHLWMDPRLWSSVVLGVRD
ncbi:MAG: zinc ABC transporter substrate-binding protein, partial [Acidobacteriota bacterium]